MERNRRGAVVSGCAVAVLLALAPVSFANADPFKGCQVVKGRWGDGTTVSVEDQAVIPPRMVQIEVPHRQRKLGQVFFMFKKVFHCLESLWMIVYIQKGVLMFANGHDNEQDTGAFATERENPWSAFGPFLVHVRAHLAIFGHAKTDEVAMPDRILIRVAICSSGGWDMFNDPPRWFLDTNDIVVAIRLQDSGNIEPTAVGIETDTLKAIHHLDLILCVLGWHPNACRLGVF